MFTNKLKQIHKLQVKLMAQHYRRALEAKREGRPVVYVTAMFPVEIVKAFEPYIATVYPENHAALLSARGLSHVAELSESGGVDRLGCAYELINTGYILGGHGRLEVKDLLDAASRPIPKLPEPDILLACDNQCRVVCEWFKHISEVLGNKPYKMINVGDRYDGSLDEKRLGYVRKQLEELITWLEDYTGTKLNEAHLLDVANKSRAAIQLWQRYLDMGTLAPSPVSAFDGFSHMALIVSERGHPSAIDYYQQLIEATEDAAIEMSSGDQTERHRVLWDNLATWYNFRELHNYFSENGISVVGSTYLDAWRKELDPTDMDRLLDSIAKTYSTMYTNLTVPERVQLYIEMVKKYRVGGVLFHKNLSCHTFSLRVGKIAEQLKQHFGPEFRTVVFEGCQGIEGRFHKHAFEMGINVNFVER